MDGLSELRNRLDNIDNEILRLFAERMGTAAEIGKLKRAEGRPVRDKEREDEVMASRLGLLPIEYREGGERLVRLLMDEAVRVQAKGLNLYLIGMPDCGKTRMGKKLRALSGMPLVDTDKYVMRIAQRTIDEIFDEKSEEFFRSIEREVLRLAASAGGTVVALGGGTPLWGNNAELIKNTGVVVFLDRRLEALLGQCTVNRPLLRGSSEEEINSKIESLFYERHGRYSELADLTVDPDAEGAEENILKFFQNRLTNY